MLDVRIDCCRLKIKHSFLRKFECNIFDIDGVGIDNNTFIINLPAKQHRFNFHQKQLSEMTEIYEHIVKCRKEPLTTMCS